MRQSQTGRPGELAVDMDSHSQTVAVAEELGEVVIEAEGLSKRAEERDGAAEVRLPEADCHNLNVALW